MNSITSSAGSLISWSVGGCNGSQTQEQHRRTRKHGQRHRHRYKRTSGKFTQAPQGATCTRPREATEAASRPYSVGVCTTQTGLNLEEGLAPHGMVILPDNLLDHFEVLESRDASLRRKFCIKHSNAVSSGRSRFGSSQHHHIQHRQSERRASDDLGSPQVDDAPWPPKLHSYVTVAGTKAVFLWKLRGSLHPAVAAQFGARGSSRPQRPLHSSSHQARLRFVYGCRFVFGCGTGARWAAGTPGPHAGGRAGARRGGGRTRLHTELNLHVLPGLARHSHLP